MKTSTSAILILTVGLAACGSGSGNHPFPGDPMPSPGPNPNPLPTVSRVGYRLPITPASYNFIAQNANTFRDSGQINSLNVDGREIKIIPDGISTGGIYSETSNGTPQRMVGSNSLSYTRFGYVHDNTRQGYMLAQGQETGTMPNTVGPITYHGNVVHADRIDQTLTAGAASFNVDLGNHTINGILYPNGKPTITLENGIITGSGFSNNANSPGNQTHFQGSFYGPNAEELGGIYYKQGEYSGAFGAKLP